MSVPVSYREYEYEHLDDGNCIVMISDGCSSVYIKEPEKENEKEKEKLVKKVIAKKRVYTHDIIPDLKIWKCKDPDHDNVYFEDKDITKAECMLECEDIINRLVKTDLIGIHSNAIKKIYGKQWRKLMTKGKISINPDYFGINDYYVPDYLKLTKTGKYFNIFISAKTGLSTKDSNIFYNIQKKRNKGNFNPNFKDQVVDLRIGCTGMRKTYIDNRKMLREAKLAGYPIYKWDGEKDIPHCPICGSEDVYLDSAGDKSIKHECVFSTNDGVETEYRNGYSKDTLNMDKHIDKVCTDNDPITIQHYEWKDEYGKEHTYNYMVDSSESVYANVKLDNIIGEDNEGNYIINSEHISDNDVVDDGATQWDIVSEHMDILDYHKYESRQLDRMRINTFGSRRDLIRESNKRDDNWKLILGRRDALHTQINQHTKIGKLGL